MTAEAFLRSLPCDPKTRLAELDGALQFPTPHWSPDERAEVVSERLRLMRANPVRKGKR